MKHRTTFLFRFGVASAPALALAVACALPAQTVQAKVTEQEAQALGNELTCLGAEKAGNKDGTIPAFSGKWVGVPPGVKFESGHNYPDPYANEKPLFVITAKNLQKYASRLTDGQLALFKKYPETYRMPVYPTHRDFGYSEQTCKNARDNAIKAELEDDGAGLKALNGAPPFPIPKSGSELLWNHLLASTVFSYNALQDQAVVYPNGDIAWGKVRFEVYSPALAPNTSTSTDGIYAYFKTQTLLPLRDKGSIIVGNEQYNHKRNPRLGYIYSPGTRRVRQLPDYGFDMPQGPGGFRTIDDDRLFNGSPERYEWKIIGKKEVYVPWDGYRIQEADVKYADLLKPNHINPDFMRYELRRVWVLEATLKPGYRHQYARRVMYLDEDSWNGMMAEHYDSRGQLWRFAEINYFYAFDSGTYVNSTSIYYDLNSGAYMTDKMTNHSPPTINAGRYTKSEFTPDAARMAGL